MPSDQPVRAKGRGRGKPDDTTEKPGGASTPDDKKKEVSTTAKAKDDKTIAVYELYGEGNSRSPSRPFKAAGEPRPEKSRGKETSEDGTSA